MTEQVKAPETGSELGSKPPRRSHTRGFGAGFLVKLALMGLVNAFGLYGIVASATVGSWAICLFLVLALVIADLIYFVPSRRMLPGKYLSLIHI